MDCPAESDTTAVEDDDAALAAEADDADADEAEADTIMPLVKNDGPGPVRTMGDSIDRDISG